MTADTQKYLHFVPLGHWLVGFLATPSSVAKKDLPALVCKTRVLLGERRADDLKMVSHLSRVYIIDKPRVCSTLYEFTSDEMRILQQDKKGLRAGIELLLLLFYHNSSRKKARLSYNCKVNRYFGSYSAPNLDFLSITPSGQESRKRTSQERASFFTSSLTLVICGT